MALDGPKEDDETFNDNGLTFVMNSKLYQDVKPVTVDYVSSPMGAGFRISSNMSSGESCGSSCSTNNSCSC
jgi:Fe-S cluster assembly iron-binding protein IscA